MIYKLVISGTQKKAFANQSLNRNEGGLIKQKRYILDIIICVGKKISLIIISIMFTGLNLNAIILCGLGGKSNTRDTIQDHVRCSARGNSSTGALIRTKDLDTVPV